MTSTRKSLELSAHDIWRDERFWFSSRYFSTSCFLTENFLEKIAFVFTLFLLVAPESGPTLPLRPPHHCSWNKNRFLLLSIFFHVPSSWPKGFYNYRLFFSVSPIFLNVFIKSSFLIVFSVTVATKKAKYFFVIQGRFYWKFLVQPRNDNASTKLFSKSMLHICWLLRQIKLCDKH